MKNLETLKNVANNHNCSNCNNQSIKFVAPSISDDNTTYSTCSNCGNVEIIITSKDENNEDVFRFNDTPKNTSENDSLTLRLLIKDAKASYDAIGHNVTKYFTSEDEAKAYKEELQNTYNDDDYDYEDDSDEYYNDYKEDNDYENSLLYDSEDIFKSDNCSIDTNSMDLDDKLHTFVIMNKKTYISSVVTAKDLDELTEIIERDFKDVDVKIYKTSDEIVVSKKTMLSIK
jgi:hypothetical protein